MNLQTPRGGYLWQENLGGGQNQEGLEFRRKERTNSHSTLHRRDGETEGELRILTTPTAPEALLRARTKNQYEPGRGKYEGITSLLANRKAAGTEANKCICKFRFD